MAVAIVCESCQKWEQAEKKAADPKMTLQNNPLVDRSDEYKQRELRRSNMERLERDAANYNGIHGNAYAAIRSMTFKGE